MHKSKSPALELEILHPNQKGTMQVAIAYWEVAVGTHNIWGYIGEARPLYMKMNELWQEVLCNVTKIDFTQDITVSIWMNMNEHIRVCFLLWPHQIYISIGEKLADFQQIGGGGTG